MKNLSENLSEILAEATMMDPENVTPSQLMAEEFVKMFPMCLPEVVTFDDNTGELVIDAMALEKKIKRWGLMWNFKPAVTAKLASLGVNSLSILGGGRHAAAHGDIFPALYSARRLRISAQSRVQSR